MLGGLDAVQDTSTASQPNDNIVGRRILPKRRILASPMSIGVAWGSAMPFSGGRAQASKWMTKPQAEIPLVIALEQSLRHEHRELGILPSPPQESLAMDSNQSRRLSQSGTLGKKAQDDGGHGAGFQKTKALHYPCRPVREACEALQLTMAQSAR